MTLTQGLDIESATKHHRQRVRLMNGEQVVYQADVDAMDKPHAVKLAIRKYRDGGRKDDPWDTIKVSRP